METWLFSPTDTWRQPNLSEYRWTSCRSAAYLFRKHSINLGYGFSASSYSKNGLAIVQGVNDTKDLIQNVIKPPNFQSPKRVYIVGASEGGLITTLSAEQLPNVYNAATGASHRRLRADRQLSSAD